MGACEEPIDSMRGGHGQGDPRSVAVDALRRWERGEGHPAALAERLAAAHRLAGANHRLVHELVLGTVRWQRWLDHVAAAYLARPAPPDLQRLLRLGAYQLLFLGVTMPAYAAVHATVQAARRSGIRQWPGVVNAVCRRIAVDAAAWEERRRELEEKDPGLALSHPPLLAERWCHALGGDAARELMRHDNRPASTFLRVNELGRTDRDSLLARLAEAGVAAAAWAEHPLVIRLGRGAAVRALPGYAEGAFYVQDPSTLPAVEALEPVPGERILDLCAAPGGKTSYLAQLMGDAGEIVAVDVDAARLRRMDENLRRLRIACVQTRFWAAGAELESVTGAATFDAVLLDAPCSNTGVIGRRPEVRWRLGPGDFTRLQALQRALLRAAAGRVRPGGRLVYSTCAIEPEECEAVVAELAAASWDLSAQRRIEGWRSGHDSGFYAALRRRETG